MKVLMNGAKQPVEVNDSYGARLIEQGKAIPTPAATAPPAEEKKEKPVNRKRR